MIETSLKIAWKYAATFSNLQKSLDIFVNFWKMIRKVHTSDRLILFSKIFGNVWKSLGNC